MKYCIYCQTTFDGDYCPTCGAVSNEPVPEKPKGRKGAIVRMIISGVIAAIMLMATIAGFGTLPVCLPASAVWALLWRWFGSP